MPLSPELGRYASYEGMPSDYLAHEITVFKRKRKKPVLERALNAADTVSRVSVNGFFDALTTIRTHTPNAVGKFPWEKWYFEEYPEAGDSEKKRTWKELNERGIDATQMYVLYLQNKHVVPEKMLLRLADQATTRDSQQSWLSFNNEVQEHLRDWVTHEWPQAITQGVSKGLMSVVPQHPGIDGLYFLGGSAATGYVSVDQKLKKSSFNNHINRMGGDFILLLKTHYLSHQRSLAEFRTFSDAEISEMSQRLFLGSRLGIESTAMRTEAKGIALGVTLAQAAQDVVSGSAVNALINLIGPTLAAGYLYRKMRKENTGEAVDRYIEAQTELLVEGEKVSRSLSSQRGTGISINMEETGIPEKRRILVDELTRSGGRTLNPINQTPIWLAAGSTVTHDILPTQLAPGAQSLVTGGIIVAALTPYGEEFTRQRNAEVRRHEVERIGEMIEAIDTAEHRVPRYADLAEVVIDGDSNLSRNEALPKMAGPLLIHHLDTGVPGKSVNIEEDIVLQPGLSFVIAPSGWGKSSLLQLIAREQGGKDTQVRKGIDFRRIDPRAMRDLVHNVEAIPPDSSLTIAEHMVPFVTDTDPTALKEIISDPSFHNVLAKSLGMDINDIAKIAKELPEKEELLQQWVENPSGDRADIEAFIASNILTGAFSNLVRGLYSDIKTPGQAAEYLRRKPGAMQGTSTGEAQRLQLLKAFMKEHPVLLLDEPIANVEGQETHTAMEFYLGSNGDYATKHSQHLVTNAISQYMGKYPNTVIIIAANETKLKDHFYNNNRGILDKVLIPQKAPDGRAISWMAIPAARDEA